MSALVKNKQDWGRNSDTRQEENGSLVKILYSFSEKLCCTPLE